MTKAYLQRVYVENLVGVAHRECLLPSDLVLDGDAFDHFDNIAAQAYTRQGLQLQKTIKQILLTHPHIIAPLSWGTSPEEFEIRRAASFLYTSGYVTGVFDPLYNELGSVSESYKQPQKLLQKKLRYVTYFDELSELFYNHVNSAKERRVLVRPPGSVPQPYEEDDYDIIAHREKVVTKRNVRSVFSFLLLYQLATQFRMAQNDLETEDRILRSFDKFAEFLRNYKDHKDYLEWEIQFANFLDVNPWLVKLAIEWASSEKFIIPFHRVNSNKFFVDEADYLLERKDKDDVAFFVSSGDFNYHRVLPFRRQNLVDESLEPIRRVKLFIGKEFQVDPAKDTLKKIGELRSSGEYDLLQAALGELFDELSKPASDTFDRYRFEEAGETIVLEQERIGHSRMLANVSRICTYASVPVGILGLVLQPPYGAGLGFVVGGVGKAAQFALDVEAQRRKWVVRVAS